MENEKQRIYAVIAIVALVSVLLSCTVGALAGSVAGFLAGRNQGRLAAERAMDWDFDEMPEFRREFHREWMEERPFPLPEHDEDVPPFGMMPPAMQGALVVEVIPDTAADWAGLKAGDVIVGIDRTPINQRNQLPDVIRQFEPGDRVTIRVWREGEEETLRLELGEHPEESGRAYLGIYFETIMGGPAFEFPND